ncbi:MAG: 16S rRNA (cytosine(1402)-N(4))-methyltransferase RsmH [Oscillospiraceae bacterium]|nr:16S rRNA (cytosine(1402)-N(4))-methyltransferase RsmH [Oscillospiraceae bacterium]
MDSVFRHETVLLAETVMALNPKPGGIFLDGTAGSGGHTALLLERILPGGAILALDRDPDAAEHLRLRFRENPNVAVLQENFFNAKAILRERGIAGLHGAVLDLGVSSVQLDRPERGFSYHHEAELNMLMEKKGVTAAEWVNTLPEQQLREIFWSYGQEKFAPSMAKAIVRAREKAPVRTTTELADILSGAVPAAARRDGHPARKAFMALRYFVNREIDGLDEALRELFGCLLPGGRISCITFNSLEDSIVKKVFRSFCEGCVCPKEFPVCRCNRTPGGRIPQKPLLPSPEEIARNPRSRSAKLRVIEKLRIEN